MMACNMRQMIEEFVPVLKTEDLPEGKMKAVNFAGDVVCIIHLKGSFYAINNICTHEGAPLDEGSIQGFEVECPWHGARFDIRTGEVKAPPAEKPVPTYQVKVNGDEILIRQQARN